MRRRPLVQFKIQLLDRVILRRSCQVTLPGQPKCWRTVRRPLPQPLPLPTSTPSPIPTEVPTPGAEVLAKGLNLRSGPGTNYDIVDGLAKGATMEVLGLTGDRQWAKVRTSSGRVGYVSAGSRYIAQNEAAAGLPTLSPASLPATPTPRPTAKPTVPAAGPVAAASPDPSGARGNGTTQNIRPDVLEQIIAMYGSVDSMVGHEFVMNGALGLQNGSNPTFHSKVRWAKLIEDRGLGTAYDGSRPSRRYTLDVGGGERKHLALMLEMGAETRPPIDPILFGVWGYDWGRFPGPMASLCGICTM